MKSLQAIKLVLLVLIIPTLWGCRSDKLTRGKAEEIIKNSIKFPYVESKSIFNSYAMGPNGESSQGNRSAGGPETKEMHDFFLKNNLMTIAETHDEGNNYWTDIRIGFTEEGKKYATDIEYSNWWRWHKIILCDIIFDEITGIQINEQTNVARLEYSLKRTNWTPFGKYFKEKEPSKYPEIITGKNATLQKYDDGWRIVQ
jgi:hypothetical protein